MDSLSLTHPCPVYFFSKKYPEKVAIYAKNNVVTYQELNKRIAFFSTYLINTFSFNRSSPVTILMKDPVDIIVCFFSLIRIGVSVLILDPKSPSSKVSDVMKQANSQILIKEVTYKEDVAVQNEPILTLNQWVHVVPTSGSSGRPKLVVLSLGNYMAHVEGSQQQIPVLKTSVWHLVLPLSHVSGMSIVFRTVLNGGAISLEGSSAGPTHISLVETQFHRYAKEHLPFLKDISYILIGGSRVSDSVLEFSRIHNFESHIFPTYGMSELCSQIATRDVVLPHLTVKIKNGKVHVKGDSLFQGYLESSQCVLQLDEEGFYDTGDCGEIENRSLRVLGRSDRMFISGGENIYPEEIEQALRSLPYIQEAFVISVPDDVFQEKPIGFIKPFIKDFDVLKSDLNSLLSSYKIPKTYLPLPEKKESELKQSFENLLKSYQDIQKSVDN